MFEKFRNELLSEFVFVFHDEGVAIIGPSDEVGVPPIIQETESKLALIARGQRWTLTWQVSE